jgi:O-6-methylguanine DNA methyltransferase
MQKLDFSEKVKNIVRGIPKGETLSYKEVAIKAGNPRTSRAVARVMSTNFDPSVPCHRVICANGALGGYNVGERERDTLSQEIVDVLDKISFNLNNPSNGEAIKRLILVNEGVILK